MSKRYCGRDFSDIEIDIIHQLIQNNPDKTRYFLSKEVCKTFNWRKPDGDLKDMSCRVAMLKMHREGIIKLPEPKGKFFADKYEIQITKRTDPELPITVTAGKLFGLHLELVDNRNSSKLWNEYIDRYHYLGHKTLPGAQIRYFIKANNQILGALGFSAAAWLIAPRDKFIGWSHEQRERNLYLVVNNSRTLIFPWIFCRNLVSKVFSIVVKQLPQDWYSKYNYAPVLLETFIEKKFCGASYKASNWICVGNTKGRGKLEKSHKQVLPIKSIWLYPLLKNFKKNLCI